MVGFVVLVLALITILPPPLPLVVVTSSLTAVAAAVVACDLVGPPSLTSASPLSALPSILPPSSSSPLVVSGTRVESGASGGYAESGR